MRCCACSINGFNAGVDVKVIGRVEAKWKIPFEKYPGRRLHVRAIVRDGRRAFLGSQSLRRLQLEKRREVGVIINDKRVVRQMVELFEADWAQTDSGRKAAKRAKRSLAGRRLARKRTDQKRPAKTHLREAERPIAVAS